MIHYKPGICISRVSLGTFKYVFNSNYQLVNSNHFVWLSFYTKNCEKLTIIKVYYKETIIIHGDRLCRFASQIICKQWPIYLEASAWI